VARPSGYYPSPGKGWSGQSRVPRPTTVGNGSYAQHAPEPNSWWGRRPIGVSDSGRTGLRKPVAKVDIRGERKIWISPTSTSQMVKNNNSLSVLIPIWRAVRVDVVVLGRLLSARSVSGRAWPRTCRTRRPRSRLRKLRSELDQPARRRGAAGGHRPAAPDRRRGRRSVEPRRG